MLGMQGRLDRAKLGRIALAHQARPDRSTGVSPAHREWKREETLSVRTERTRGRQALGGLDRG